MLKINQFNSYLCTLNTSHRMRKAENTTVWGITAFLVLFFINTGNAQNTISAKYQRIGINAITTAVPFLLIAPDARAGSMGDAGVASPADANSAHWNASKLAWIDKKVGFSLSYTPWLHALVPDIHLAYLSGYNKIDKNQAISASLLYFSLGSITFTDANGQDIGSFTPNEFAVDLAYARKMSKYFSGGLALRYINSNLTGGIVVENTTPSKAGRAVAADISALYQNTELKVSGKKSRLAAGINISNMGNRISYTQTGNRDFIPTNLKLGGSLTLDLDQYNSLSFNLDWNKLLIPTPPKYLLDSNNKVVVDADGNKVIDKGKNPNVSVASGIAQSFYDAPGGMKEELREFTHSFGMEYWYDKQFALRAGFFYENPTKGNRKYITVGAGLKLNVFGLDFGYLIPLEQRNPLENTLRFSLLFDFDAFKSQNKPEGE